ncbi:hypothetical protein SBRY_50622 [Actinacidiphila bryophytorum]|uniref:Uncharacterized protein n=1 Tax=Actinacidiphila bryophytorum TaxID=1436133 RepID=A0A9W4MJI1_9ACTN|nr:hypothetical protein SBRY_50622 [Actinacidiphila bryophytorum]
MDRQQRHQPAMAADTGLSRRPACRMCRHLPVAARPGRADIPSRSTVGPLADGQAGAGSGQHRAGRNQQHRHQRVLSTTTVARVRQRRQPLSENRHFTLMRRRRLGHTDGGRPAAHRGPVVQGDLVGHPVNRSLAVFITARRTPFVRTTSDPARSPAL